MQAAFFSNNKFDIERVYPQSRLKKLTEECQVFPEIVTSQQLNAILPELKEIEVIFSTWGMYALTEVQLDHLPNLKAVFYAAGSVQSFARPFLKRGITVVSGWGANAYPVAEFTMAQILLANKGYFRNFRDSAHTKSRNTAYSARGNYGAKVALLGAGMISRRLIALLKNFELSILVYDAFIPTQEYDQRGVSRVSLEEAFRLGQVVSNHLADVPATRGLLSHNYFSIMQPGAVFINTGRGATVVEEDLVSVMMNRPDLTALLDVTDPEPPLPGSPLYKVPNIFMSSHIAGSMGDEVLRMADIIIEEFLRWKNNKPLRYGVSLEMLSTMA